jgi:hypothetical protein
MDKNTENQILERNTFSNKEIIDFEHKLQNHILLLKNSKGQSVDSEFDENFAESEEEITLQEFILGN